MALRAQTGNTFRHTVTGAGTRGPLRDLIGTRIDRGQLPPVALSAYPASGRLALAGKHRLEPVRRHRDQGNRSAGIGNEV